MADKQKTENFIMRGQFIRRAYRLLAFPFVKLYLKISKKVVFAWGGYADHSTVFDGYNFIGENAYVSTCHFGKGSYASDCTRLYNVKIGKFTSIGTNVIGISGTHPSKDFYSTSPSTYSLNPVNGLSFVDEQLFEDVTEPIIIENDVWIGSGAILLPGITVANGTIIGAGSVVTKSTEPYGVYVGNPARLIRKRFDQERINKLLSEK